MSVTIYHNPRCSKSRQTLSLIEDAGQQADIILYTKTAPTQAEIKDLLKKLGFDDPRALMRKGESIYKELGLKAETDENALLLAMSSYPKLIERPIVVKGNKAVLGRPPENAAQFL